MDEKTIIEIGLAALGGAFTVIWWLLRKKDDAQEKKIDLLFEKHDLDASKLEELRLQIAEKHYIKPELDSKFDRLEASIKSGMTELGGKFDALSKILIERAK